jgi:hypothetical protein
MVATSFILLCWLMPANVIAASSAIAIDMPLTPINTTESISLVAYFLHADLRCDNAGCVVQVAQTYQVRNQGQETTLQLGLPVEEGLPAYVLRFEGGPALEPGAPSADYAATWAISLGRNEQKRVVLTSSHPPQQGRFVSWRCEMSYLAPWGAIQGARMEYLFPQPITDDALLSAEPGNPRFGEGGLLYWDYEVLQDPLNMEVIALSPATWQQFQALRSGQKHEDLALLYEALYQEAQQNGLPMADPYAREVAEWMEVLRARPDDQDARRNLARVFRARAGATPSLRLNYLLLLAEQLDVLLQQTGDVETANELVRVYEEASRIASESDDPAGALKYLRQASTVPGAAPSGSQEVLALRLALSLAQEGQVAEALQQVQDILSPDLREVLWRYMPPFSSARSQVITGPQQRIVHCQLLLYPPAVDKVDARLEEIALALRSIDGCQISWQSQVVSPNEIAPTMPVTTTVTMSVTYNSLAVLGERSKAVVEGLAPDPDLISVFVAAPWHSVPSTYSIERGLWQDHLSYQSEADLTSLQHPWEEGSDYVRWQLVELRNASPGDERAQIEHQLAVLVLEQQSQIWELIPSGTYCLHQVNYPEYPTYHPTWLLSWGQERSLQSSHTFYRWSRVLATASGAILLLMLILSRALRRL